MTIEIHTHGTRATLLCNGFPGCRQSVRAAAVPGAVIDAGDVRADAAELAGWTRDGARDLCSRCAGIEEQLRDEQEEERMLQERHEMEVREMEQHFHDHPHG